MSKHTRGPLKVVTNADGIVDIYAEAYDGFPVASHIDGHDWHAGDNVTPSVIANAHLLAAAYTSYDKHCGERAVECAKSDLLGELLEACEAALNDMINNARSYGGDENEFPSVIKLRDAIAKATGE